MRHFDSSTVSTFRPFSWRNDWIVSMTGLAHAWALWERTVRTFYIFFTNRYFRGLHRYAKSYHTLSCVWFSLFVWDRSWSLHSWMRLQILCDSVINIMCVLDMKPSWTAARWCCTGILWWKPTVCVRYVVMWWRGCWRTVHSWGKTFREANFVINQLQTIKGNLFR